ncbi:MAG: hypothetical protein PHN31_03915 [Candidatus Gracilibacteria bacterium]|nr:hypothetical protein [Candidatus Gracilibacteria bacterium]
MEIFYKNNKLIIQNTSKKEVIFDITSQDISIDLFSISKQGEYEKGSILAVVKKHNGSLFYNLNLDGYKVVIITNDTFEFNEEFLSFFGDIDLLILPGSKNSIKIYENLEAKIVLPFGEGKDIFFTSISQHKEEVESHKIKGAILGDVTEFVNLKIG